MFPNYTSKDQQLISGHDKLPRTFSRPNSFESAEETATAASTCAVVAVVVEIWGTTPNDIHLEIAILRRKGEVGVD